VELGSNVRGYTLTEPCGSDGNRPWRGIAPDGSPVFIRLLAAYVLTTEHADAVLPFLQRYRDLKHPSLVPLRDFWIENKELVLVTDWADCESLDDRFHRMSYAGAPLASAELVPLFAPLAEALDFLHGPEFYYGGVRGRDILLHGGRPLLDVPRIPNDSTARVGSGLGLVRWTFTTAPEVFFDRECAQSDQYSLAACYAEFRLGRRLIPDVKNWRALALAHSQNQEPDLEPLPVAERAVLQRALSKSPDRRYFNCVTLIAQLSRAVSISRDL
jgi:hypothetical protein